MESEGTRRTAPEESSELSSQTIFEIDSEMNELIGYMKDIVMVLSCINEDSLVFSVPYYLLWASEEKVERLDDVCQEMVERLIKSERKDGLK